MEVLLTCLGLSDPYTDPDRRVPGPLLTLLKERRFETVHLLWACSPQMNSISRETHKAILDGRLADRVLFETFDAMDPSDIEAVFIGMRECCHRILKSHREESPSYSVQISGGTPQMQASWMVLVGSGILPARMLAVRPRYIAGVRPPYVREVTFNLAEQAAGELASERSLVIVSQQEEITRLRMELEETRSRLVSNAVTGDEDEIPDGFNLTEYLAAERRRLCALALRKHPNNASEAARMLGLPPHTLRQSAARTGLRPRRKSG